MKVKRMTAYCCIEGGGTISGCGCDNPNHGYAYFDVQTPLPGDEIVDAAPTPQRADAEDVERVAMSDDDRELYGKLTRKVSGVHHANASPSLPLRIELTMGEINRLRTALAAMPRASQQAGRTEREVVAACIYGHLHSDFAWSPAMARPVGWTEADRFAKDTCYKVADAILALQPAREGRDASR